MYFGDTVIQIMSTPTPTPTPVPPGQAPPFQVIDDQHQAGVIIITAAICLSISLVCLLIRLYVRLYLSPPFAYDDYVLLGATVSIYIHIDKLLRRWNPEQVN